MDVILIATQWRARDIAREMTASGIAAPSLLLEHQGRLVDYRRDDHPYRDIPMQADADSPASVLRFVRRPKA